MNHRTRILVAGLAASSALLGGCSRGNESEGDVATQVQSQNTVRANLVYYAMPG